MSEFYNTKTAYRLTLSEVDSKKYIEFVVDEKVKKKKFQKHILLDNAKEKALINAWNIIEVYSWTGQIVDQY